MKIDSDNKSLSTPIIFITRVTQSCGKPLVYMTRRINALLEDYRLGSNIINTD